MTEKKVIYYELLVLRCCRGQKDALVRANPQDWRVKLNEQLAIVIFFMLVFIGLYLIIRALYRLEFKTREKLLEIELRLAELDEKIDNVLFRAERGADD